MLGTKGIVDACTGIPLKDEDEEFIKPFLENNIEKIFYIGEVVIRADSRAKGLGTKLILQMLDLIDKSKFKIACVYTVDRGQNHPLQPPAYKPSEILWEKLNFVKDQKKIVYYQWKDIGDLIETNKPMNVWTKKLT